LGGTGEHEEAGGPASLGGPYWKAGSRASASPARKRIHAAPAVRGDV